MPLTARTDGPLYNMYTLARHLKKFGLAEVEAVAHARVPIVKCIDKSLNLSIDMNVGHVLGVHNSGLLNAYTRCDGRVKPLIMLIKMWAKKRDLNDPSDKRTFN
jgi:DNA polymerase sigma